MPQIQANALTAIIQALPELVKELHVMNQLKAMELEGRITNDWGSIPLEKLYDLVGIADNIDDD